MNAEKLAKAKSLGFSDRQIANLTGTTEDAVRAKRKELGLVPSYRLVDTCAAEFEAYTPYYYSTYDRGDDDEVIRSASGGDDLDGPNRIGQGIEFDYCCVHAAFALKDGFETIMVNSNARRFRPTMTTTSCISNRSPGRRSAHLRARAMLGSHRAVWRANAAQSRPRFAKERGQGHGHIAAEH
jgi:hypothetical protein